MRPLSRVDELAPSLRAAMKELRRATLDDTSLPFTEIEVIRVRCAQLNGCETCFNCRMDRDDPERAARADGLADARVLRGRRRREDLAVLTERERLIREFCGRYSNDHFSLDEDEELWARMKARFGDTELVEIGITVMSFTMSARFNHVLGVDEVVGDFPLGVARARDLGGVTPPRAAVRHRCWWSVAAAPSRRFVQARARCRSSTRRSSSPTSLQLGEVADVATRSFSIVPSAHETLDDVLRLHAELRADDVAGTVVTHGDRHARGGRLRTRPPVGSRHAARRHGRDAQREPREPRRAGEHPRLRDHRGLGRCSRTRSAGRAERPDPRRASRAQGAHGEPRCVRVADRGADRLRRRGGRRVSSSSRAGARRFASVPRVRSISRSRC